jgi:hypothetical protein
MDNLNGASLASQKQKNELNKLNEAYRNGTSELQKKAKIEDAAAQKELANTKIREQAQKRLADSKTLADRALNYTKGMYSPQGVLSVNNMQKAILRDGFLFMPEIAESAECFSCQRIPAHRPQ